MEVIYHRLIQPDLSSALRFYNKEGGTPLGDRFFEAVESTVTKVVKHPGRFHFIAPVLRRAGLKNFPYHLLFEEREAGIRILVLRHHKRHPHFGLGRH